MEILDTTQACFVVDDDLFNFTLEGGEGEEEVVDPTIFKGGASASSSSLDSSNPAAASFGRGNLTRSFPEFVEEELEWLSNKDAFPAVETCFGILSDNPELVSNHQSPVSVLENSTVSSNSNTNSSSNINNNNNSSSVASCCNSLKVPTNHPVRARTKRSRRRRDSVQHSLWLSQVNRHVFKKSRRDISFSLPPTPVTASSGGAGEGTGRRCLHCHTDKTPQWRAGPIGPKTLCNACGVRYKSGRLLPEYRPANSPTFSSVLHSNSHRKVVEMRRQKQVGPGEGISHRVDIA